MTIAIAAKGASVLGSIAKFLFTSKLGIALTAGTVGLQLGSNNYSSYAMGSPAMAQMMMMRGGMPMGGMPMGGMPYPGVG